MSEYLEIYISFLKVGLFMFGGGYSMLPLLIRELTDRRKWVTEQEILDYFAIAQCTPGVIAINTATFVGHKKKGIPGAVAATLGVVTGPIILILLIVYLLSTIWTSVTFQHALAGVRIAVAALIFSSVFRLAKSNVKTAFDVVLCISSFLLITFLKISPVFIVIGAVAIGIINSRIKQK